jgi:fused signal recognition particle receptor
VRPFESGLARTRRSFIHRLRDLALQPRLDEAYWSALEEILLGTDLSVSLVDRVTRALREREARFQLNGPGQVEDALREELRALLGTPDLALHEKGSPGVLLFVGVNGSGKTTTAAKLARRLSKQGREPLLVAADTFRAAAIEQLQIWARRVEVPVVSGTPGGDPAAVVFDAVQAARARGRDVVLADTAGRLHTKEHLMAELSKIARVAARAREGAPDEVLLVVDGTVGQNAIPQARLFSEAAGVTGIVVTKLDGTAKGGAIFTVTSELGVPVKFLGVGEGVDDLVAMDLDAFVDALFKDPPRPDRRAASPADDDRHDRPVALEPGDGSG